jgi:hypothetical protein
MDRTITVLEGFKRPETGWLTWHTPGLLDELPGRADREKEQEGEEQRDGAAA